MPRQGAPLRWLLLLTLGGLLSVGCRHKAAPTVKAGNLATVAGGLASPNLVVSDGDYLYATVQDGIVRVSRRGGSTIAVARERAFIPALVVDGDSLYYTTGDGGRVMRAPKAGGADPKVLATVQNPFGIAVDATGVYFTTRNEKGAIMKVGKDGGQATIVAGGLPQPVGLALDGGTIYATVLGQGVIRLPEAGGDPALLADDPGAFGLALDADHVYFSNVKAGAIKRVAKIGSDIDVLVTGQEPGLESIAVDKAGVYWSAPRAGKVWTVPPGGGPPSVLAEGQDGPGHTLVVGGDLYFVTFGHAGARDGRVVRLVLEGP